MITHDFSKEENMVRALAVLVPALILNFIWPDGFIAGVIKIIFAWMITFLFLQRLSLKNSWIFTAILSLFLTFCYATYDTILNLAQTNITSLHNFFVNILMNAAIYTVLSFFLTLPAWLLFWGLDFYLCRHIHRRRSKGV